MPYPYMISDSSWGVYNNTFNYSAAIFATKDPHSMANKSGVHFDNTCSLFRITSFGQKLLITYPEAKITFEGTKHSPPFPWCLCIINSLTRADGSLLSNSLISYRELQDGHVYYPAFKREAIDRLAKWSRSKSLDKLKQTSEELGGTLEEGADFCCTLKLLPHFPIIIKIWFPDHELDGSANILFNSTANHYLHTEDIAAAGEMVANFLIKHYCLIAG